MRKLILLGAGGHCKACVDIIEQIPRIKIKAIIDINLKKLNIFEKYKINGNYSLGSGTFIGSGTILDNDIKIGNNCVIGSGLTIKKNIKDNSIIK